MYRILAFVLVGIISGCAESYFRLSEESRLPYFFELPEGENREMYDLNLTYYVRASGREAVFVLDKKDSWFGGKKVTAKQDGTRPIRFDDAVDGRPSYEIVRYRGVVDVVELREKNDIIYMSDNPTVWNRLGLTKP